MNQRGGTLALTVLAGMLIGGVIAQVLIETWLGRPAEVNAVLASLAGTAVAALFGQQVFLGHQMAAGAQRADLLNALTGNGATASASTGRAIGGVGASPSTPSDTAPAGEKTTPAMTSPAP